MVRRSALSNWSRLSSCLRRRPRPRRAHARACLRGQPDGGYGLRPAEAFPVQLEARLRRDGFKVSVRNAGVSGDTTAQGRARLGWVLQSLKARPDLVILELGANDMLRGIDPAQTSANLSAMLVELKKRRIPVLLAGMKAAPNLGEDYRRRFDAVYPALARRHGGRRSIRSSSRAWSASPSSI